MIIISGPSTVGKNPLIYRICELYDMEFVAPITTRSIRKEETNGVDYLFYGKEKFQQKIVNGEISEWDYVLNNYYGYSYKFPGTVSHITHGLSRMALRIKKKYPEDITTIFLKPKKVDRIFDALEKIYKDEQLVLRKALVNEEIMHSKLFDRCFIIENSVFELLENQEFLSLINIL